MHLNWDPTRHFQPANPDPFATEGIPLPTYGNYGGPGYTAGTLGAETPDPPSPAPVDDLDALFYAHDFVFQQVRDGDLPQSAIVPATVQLVLDMQALTYTDPGSANYDPEAGLYQGFATLGLVGELVSNGAFSILPEPVQDALTAASQEALVNFEAALAEIPGEARSLHGALHVFEHKFADLLLVDF